MKIHPKIKVITKSGALDGIMTGKYTFTDTVFTFRQNNSNPEILEISGELSVLNGAKLYETDVRFDLSKSVKSKKKFLQFWQDLRETDIEIKEEYSPENEERYDKRGYEPLKKLLAKQAKVFDSYVEFYKSQKSISSESINYDNKKRIRIVKAKAKAIKIKLKMVA